MRRLRVVALAALGFIGIGAVVFPAHADNSTLRVKQGLKIAPVPLNLHDKDRGLVGLGSYLVNAGGGCNDCHTCPAYTPGHNPFQGGDGQINATNYLAGGVHFGPFTSRNLTPEGPEGKPAGMTFDEFLQVLRTGEDLDKQHPAISPLLQAMPWPIYRNLTKRDIRAIYEYLRAIPSAEPGTACTGAGQ